MSTDRDVTAIVRSWLDEGATRLPDRVLDNVLDHVPSTTQRRGLWPARRFPPMTSSLKVLLAGLAVVAAVAVGFALLPRSSDQVGPPASASPSQATTATPTPAPTPTPLPSPTGPTSLYRSEPALLPAGRYGIDRVFDGQITLDMPANWTGLGNELGAALLIKTKNAQPFGTVGNTVLLGVYTVDGVYADPCRDEQPASPRPVGVDAVIAALTHATGVQAGPVTQTTLGGLPAKVFDLNNTINMDDCVAKPFNQWSYLTVFGRPRGNGTSSGPGDHQRIWIVDVGGTIVLVNADSSDGSYADDSAELFAIVDSMRFR